MGREFWHLPQSAYQSAGNDRAIVACRKDARFGEHLLAALDSQTPLLDSAYARLGIGCLGCEHGGLRRPERERRGKEGC